jgi:hypothetical protein
MLDMQKLMRVVMPRLNLDTSNIQDQATALAFNKLMDQSDQNPFSTLDGKIIKFKVKTSTASEPVILYHGLGYTPNIAVSMSIVEEDYIGLAFSPVIDNQDTNDKTLKVIVSYPCEVDMLMFVGRSA